MRWINKVMLVACLVSSSVMAQLPTTIDTKLQKGLERAVLNFKLEPAVAAGQLAIALVDLSDPSKPHLAMLNGNQMMYAASLPKIAILLGALVEVERGQLPLDATLVDTLTQMIRHSSNEAATRALGKIGRQRLLDILQSPRFQFYDELNYGGIWVGKTYGRGSAFMRDPLAHLSHGATVYQVARFYTMLSNGTLLSPKLNALMKEILSKSSIHHKFVKGLESKPNVQIYRKSGTWKDFHADSALVEDGRHRYVMVGIAHHKDGGKWLVEIAEPLHNLITGQ